MLVDTKWRVLGHDHIVWQLVRYWASLGGKKKEQAEWLKLLEAMSVPARKWAIIPEPGEPLRNVAIPVGDHVRWTQMADRLQRNDGFF